jgi:diguanylate cyclase (GGDEF)-like protein
VLLLDIDHFKAYNDHYGHMMGDQALIQVSAAIRNAVRSRDIVARFGGEEFMVLLTNSSGKRPSGRRAYPPAGLRSENPAYV